MTECEVPTCTKPVGQNRKCYMHYWRIRHHGTTDDPKRTWEERFWLFVDKRTGDGCWTWAGSTDRAGYGLLGGRAPSRAAHRLAFLIAHGRLPLHALHTCDNPGCVRPDHIFEGDDRANHADMAAKRRSTWGEANVHAKLTAGEVLEIRRLAAERLPHRVIAARFGVSPATVSDIHRRRSWYHLPD